MISAKTITQYLTLPLPPSTNRIWQRTKGGGVALTPQVVAYKTQAGWTARACHIVPFDGRVAVEVKLFRRHNRGDTDNYLKVLLDSLIGHAYHDDKQVVELHVYRRDDRNNPRAEVTVWEVN